MTNGNHAADRWTLFGRRPLLQMLVLVLMLPQVLFAADLAVRAASPDCASPSPLLGFIHWFDPIFLVYNVLLLLVAVFTVPGITFFYVRYMKYEKLRRLRNELNEERWEANKIAIEKNVMTRFRMREYFGSMMTLTIVVLLGASIILLLKPIPGPGDVYGCGVDYSRGANMLLLGTYFGLFGADPQQYYSHLLISLTAFQFGFLGAYVYLIGDITRSYFTLDLTPQTFVAGTIRIVTGSLMALVISFTLSHSLEEPHYALPVLAFFLGHFPRTALVYLTKTGTSWLGLGGQEYQAIDLSHLPGMSNLHETRLMREGYDNVENLANARPFDFVLLTGFSYRQARQWIAQAWLCGHLREDYDDFMKRTGITSADELVEFVTRSKEGGQNDPEGYLNSATQNQYSHKISVLCALVWKWKERADRGVKA